MSETQYGTGEPEPAGPAGAPDARRMRAVRHTRLNAAWVAWICGTILLILLLVFILQNSGRQAVHLYFWTVHLPLGVSLLVAAIAGVLVTVAIGGARIFQLRRAIRSGVGGQQDVPPQQAPGIDPQDGPNPR